MSTDAEDSDYPLKALARKLGRPIASLRVSGSANDPYVVDTPFRRVPAEWFTDLYTRLKVRPGSHIRRIFYMLISQQNPVPLPSGKPFENTMECWTFLCIASRDARYLGLIPPGLIDDQRNPKPVINLSAQEASPAEITLDSGGIGSSASSWSYSGPGINLPSLALEAPTVPQRYHIEIWCEKSTMNDVLLPLGQNMISTSSPRSVK